MVNVIARLQNIGNNIDKVCRIILGLQMLAIVILVIMQLILRPLDMSIRWASELATLIFVWSVMLGSAVAVRVMLHIGLDSVVYALKPRHKFIMQIISYILLFIGLLIFTYASTIYTANSARNVATLPMIKMSWIYISLPISGLIMLYHSSVQFLELIILGDIQKVQDSAADCLDGEG